MMNPRDTMATATHSLLAHPLRSALTMLGVIIGNAAFVSMASLGEAARIYTIQRLEAFHGPNRLIAYSTADTRNPPGKDVHLVLGDADALRSGAPAIKAVAPVAGQMFSATARAETLAVWVTGTTADYLRVKNEQVAAGRFLNAAEVEQKAAVVVLGSSMRQRLFPRSNPIGRSVQISNISFRVIGVMRPKGSMDKTSPDEFVYVPLSTFVAVLRGSNQVQGIPVDYIEIAARSKVAIKDAIFQASNLLQARRGRHDFRVAPNIPYQDLIGQVSSGLTLFLAVLAGISLLIGGIGIMNVMLVTVSERTSEIGLRKAIGATNREILVTFLIEATILSASGGLIGLSFSALLMLSTSLLSPLPFVMPLWAVASSCLLSITVGLASGITPAMRAARLDPIVALRTA